MEHMLTVTLMSSLVYATMFPSANSIPVRNTPKEPDMKKLATLPEEFKCKKPRLRVVRLTELHQNETPTDEKLIPPATVLHRCDDSTGFCHDTYECCGPTKMKNVSLVFRVMNVVEGSNATQNRTLKGVDHTECGCMSRRGGGG